MSIRNITITQLRQMEDQEGFVLQGCGGSLQEWQDGINQLLAEEGINRYGNHRELVEEPAGVMLSCGIMDEEADTYAHAYVFPDNAYATLQITGVQYAIDRDAIQNRLCQNCLDSINNLWFTTQPPAEYAIISFENRTIQPLLNAHPWFAAGKYGIDCEFVDNGIIDVLIHYCPNKYS